MWKVADIPLKYLCCLCGMFLEGSPRKLECHHYICGHCNESDTLYIHCNIENKRKDIRVDWVLKREIMHVLKFEYVKCACRGSYGSLGLKSHRGSCDGELLHIFQFGKANEKVVAIGKANATTPTEQSTPVNPHGGNSVAANHNIPTTQTSSAPDPVAANPNILPKHQMRTSSTPVIPHVRSVAANPNILTKHQIQTTSAPLNPLASSCQT